MKLKYSTLLILMFLAVQGFAQTKRPAPKPAPKPVQKTKMLKYYTHSYDSFRMELRQKHVPGLVYIYSDHFGNVKAFEKNVLNDTGTVRFMDSAKFLVYKLNAPEDEQLAVSFGLEDMPALILMDANGWEIDRLIGFRTKKEVFDFIEQVNH
jgi:thioredoxin-like negative regulator of GroEL